MAKQIVGAQIGKAYTDNRFGLGAIHEHIESDGTRSEYMFMQADGAVTLNVPYSYDAATFQIEDQADAGVVPADADNVPICVSPVTLADNEYAFVLVGPGKFTATTDATGVAAAGDIVYVSATVGTLSSGATAALLKGVRTEAAIAGGASGTFYAVNRLFAEDLP